MLVKAVTLKVNVLQVFSDKSASYIQPRQSASNQSNHKEDFYAAPSSRLISLANQSRNTPVIAGWSSALVVSYHMRPSIHSLGNFLFLFFPQQLIPPSENEGAHTESNDRQK